MSEQEERKALLQLADRIDQAGGGPLYIDHLASAAIRAALERPQTQQEPEAFEQLCREHDIAGTAAARQCEVFWRAGARFVQAQQESACISSIASTLERAGETPESALRMATESVAQQGEPLTRKTAQVDVRAILEGQSVFLSTPTIDAIVSAALSAQQAGTGEASELKPCRHGHIHCLACMNNRADNALDSLLGGIEDALAATHESVPASVRAPTWTLTNPDGKQWTGATKIQCFSAETNSRVPAEVQLERIFAANPASVGEPKPSGNDPLSDFQEGQWWVREIDAWASTGTDDQKRAVAVVHHLLRSAQDAIVAHPSPEGVRWCDACGQTVTTSCPSGMCSLTEDGPLVEGWQISVADGHSGFGVYAHMTEYPEEGSVLVQKIEVPAPDAEVYGPKGLRLQQRIGGKVFEWPISEWPVLTTEVRRALFDYLKDDSGATAPDEHATLIAAAGVLTGAGFPDMARAVLALSAQQESP